MLLRQKHQSCELPNCTAPKFEKKLYNDDSTIYRTSRIKINYYLQKSGNKVDHDVDVRWVFGGSWIKLYVIVARVLMYYIMAVAHNF